jgi:DNA-binding IclR family transcriptional regulator
MGVHAIARALGIIPSTCLHILRALASEDLVVQDAETKLYILGSGVLVLAHRWLQHNPFAERAQPVLSQLSRRHGLTAIGVEILGLDHIVVVAMARAKTMVAFNAEVGSRFPALISATGRCIGAFGSYDRAELRRCFRALRWAAPPTLTAWESEVERSRRAGFSVDSGNYIAGVTVLAAPVFGAAGALSHTLVMLGISQSLPAREVERVGRDLRVHADRLSVAVPETFVAGASEPLGLRAAARSRRPRPRPRSSG